MAKLPMPSYVIIEKREFEQLFDKVEQSGDTITALNSSKNSTKTKSRFHLSNRAQKKKSRKKRSRSRSQEKNEQKSKRRKTDGKFAVSTLSITVAHKCSTWFVKFSVKTVINQKYVQIFFYVSLNLTKKS